MAKVKVEVLAANVDGHGEGSKISIEEKSAKYFESIGYVKILDAKKDDGGKDDK